MRSSLRKLVPLLVRGAIAQIKKKDLLFWLSEVKVGYFGYVIVCYLIKGYVFLIPVKNLICQDYKESLQKLINPPKILCYHIVMLVKIKKWFLSKILRKTYYRTGKCKACGKCCTQIYVKHFKHVLQDEKEFEKLQFLHSFYANLKIIGKDEIGLIFECQNLDPETKKCKIHKTRPGICRRYPQEELFTMGGALSEDCGYRMEPIIPFSEVLEKTKSNPKINLMSFVEED